MKRVFILMAIAALCMLAFSPAFAQKKVERKAYHADQECVSCHQTKKPVARPDNSACLTCHGGDMDELVKLTESLKINPHVSPHWSTNIPCATCHKEHKPSKSVCGSCHKQMAVDIK